MKKVRLYIKGKEVELENDNALILFNYSQSDLNNPSAVKNSYSQQLEVKGTKVNNEIFSNLYRVDVINAGFSILRKEPFELRDEMGDVLESGYVKLDEVEVKGKGEHVYKITLYGGLGSFLTGLKTNARGEDLTLADLKWTSLGTYDELDFEVNKNTINEAWKDCDPLTWGKTEKWQCINFAPMYNGEVEGLEQDKALINVRNVSSEYSVDLFDADFEKDGKRYTTKNGYILAKLGAKFDEWKMLEIRSWCQRPVFRVKAFFEALKNRENNGGYELRLDEKFFNDTNPFYEKTWCTLPKIEYPKADSEKKKIDVEFPLGWEDRIDFRDRIKRGAKFETIQLNVGCILEGLAGTSKVITQVGNQSSLCIYQAVAYDWLGNVVGASDCVAVGSIAVGVIDDIIRISGFKAKMNKKTNFVEMKSFSQTSLISWDGGTRSFTIEGPLYDIREIIIERTPIFVERGAAQEAVITYQFEMWGREGGVVYAKSGFLQSFAEINSNIVAVEVGGIKSFTRISKKQLMQGTQSPADYLLGFVKMFGLYVVENDKDKVVEILTRESFYKRSEIVDIEKRIDRSKGVTIKSAIADFQKLKFGNKEIKGGVGETYKKSFAKDYGEQVVDVGNRIATETKEYLKDVIYGGGVAVRDESYFFTIPMKSTGERAYNFMQLPTSYTYYGVGGDEDGEVVKKEDDARVFPKETPFYKIDNYANLDGWEKLDNRDSGGKEIADNSNVLLFMNVVHRVSSLPFRITDDTANQLNMNEGKLCWLLEYGTQNSVKPSVIPIFSRYLTASSSTGKIVAEILDFGNPLEIYDRTIKEVYGRASIYPQYFKGFVEDRYSINTKVVRLSVNWDGVDVNKELLRRVYYFDGCYWVLNSIINHDISGKNVTECEFIKLNDRNSLK